MRFPSYADLKALSRAVDTVRQLRPHIEAAAADLEVLRPQFASLNRMMADTASELAMNYRSSAELAAESLSAAQLAAEYRSAAQVASEFLPAADAFAHHRSTVATVKSLLTNKDLQELLSPRWVEQLAARMDWVQQSRELATLMRPEALAWQAHAIAGLAGEVMDEWDSSGESLESDVLAEVTAATTPGDLAKMVAESLISGVRFPLNTKEARTRATIGLIVFILTVLLPTIVSAWSAHKKDLELDNFRRNQRAMAETVASLKATVHELRTHATDSKPSDAPTYRVTKRANLRAGPSTATARLGRLGAGARVQLLASDGRWRWIDVLDASGKPTGQRGWLYRRVMTFTH
jgi:hypothetical protein